MHPTKILRPRGQNKRKIIKLMVPNKKGGSTSTKSPGRPVFWFLRYQKGWVIPNDISPSVITSTIIHFDVSQILIDGGSLCDIIYSDLLKKMILKKETMWPYKESYLQAFNDTTTYPWVYIELMISMGNGKYVRTVNSHFFVVLYKRVYNCILAYPLWRP